MGEEAAAEAKEAVVGQLETLAKKVLGSTAFNEWQLLEGAEMPETDADVEEVDIQVCGLQHTDCCLSP